MDLSGLNFFEEGEKRTQKSIAEATAIARKRKTSVSQVMKDKKDTSNNAVFWPPPYNKFGGKIDETDIGEYFARLENVKASLDNGLSIDDCILAHIQDTETEEEIEKNYKDYHSRKKAINKLRAKRDSFIHFTMLAYLGFLKYTTPCANGSAHLFEKAKKMTGDLAFSTLLEAVRKYNSHFIETDEDLQRYVRHDQADRIAKTQIEEISDQFRNYFAGDVESLGEEMITFASCIRNEQVTALFRTLEETAGFQPSASRIYGFWKVLDNKGRKRYSA
ncbi:hypothetical protein KY326_03665 [Candidatus Woesearchaeota archaeon]|nr:hypothetical protein [Candidatus Woesearchaeota archaeon]